MISMNLIINITMVCLITIVLGFILGLAVTYVVDRRLANISINLPKIDMRTLQMYDSSKRSSQEKMS